MKKIYKISQRSKSIIAVLMTIFQIRLTGLVSNTINSGSVKDYNEIIESFADFLQSEGIDDPQQIYEYYNYAMWNGYFSHNHKLQYSLDRKIYIDNAGMGIMSGDAVCLNYADMLSLIFEEMGFNSYMTMCYVEPDNISIEPIRTDKDIIRNVDRSGSELLDNVVVKTIMKVFGNHAITCVESNGELYFFDPTNFVYLDKTGFNDINIINGEGKFDLRYFTSLLFENANIFKVATYKNKDGYEEKVLEKQQIEIDVEGLETFYNEQKGNIESIAKNGEIKGTVIALILYSFVASYIKILLKKMLKKAVINFEQNDKTNLFPKLKEYFNEKNISTEFEVLKSYELIENSFGVKDNMFKDLSKKAIELLENLLTQRKVQHFMLSECLRNLGYHANVCYAKKYSNRFIKMEVPLVVYYENGKAYAYDYEIEELLYMDNNVLYSLDGKYKYKLSDKYFETNFEIGNKEEIQSKMNSENTILNKEDIKTLRKTKVLR